MLSMCSYKIRSNVCFNVQLFNKFEATLPSYKIENNNSRSIDMYGAISHLATSWGLRQSRCTQVLRWSWRSPTEPKGWRDESMAKAKKICRGCRCCNELKGPNLKSLCSYPKGKIPLGEVEDPTCC